MEVKVSCPRCGSTELIPLTFGTNGASSPEIRRPRFKCLDCRRCFSDVRDVTPEPVAVAREAPQVGDPPPARLRLVQPWLRPGVG